MNRLYYFFIGFLTCSIVWRVDQGVYDNIFFPLAIWGMMVSLVVILEIEAHRKIVIKRHLNRLFGPLGTKQ